MKITAIGRCMALAVIKHVTPYLSSEDTIWDIVV